MNNRIPKLKTLPAMFSLFGCLLLASGLMSPLKAQEENMNLDFEAVKKLEGGIKVPVAWYVRNYGVKLSKDAHKGKYALLIHSWYNHVHTTTYSMPQDQESELSGGIHNPTPYTERPLRLGGYYKRTEQLHAEDSAEVRVLLFKKSGDQIDTVGFGEGRLGPSEKYKWFGVDIQYRDAETKPDFVSIEFTSGNMRSRDQAEFNYLYLDDLNLVMPDEVFYGTIRAKQIR